MLCYDKIITTHPEVIEIQQSKDAYVLTESYPDPTAIPSKESLAFGVCRPALPDSDDPHRLRAMLVPSARLRRPNGVASSELKRRHRSKAARFGDENECER